MLGVLQLFASAAFILGLTACIFPKRILGTSRKTGIFLIIFGSLIAIFCENHPALTSIFSVIIIFGWIGRRIAASSIESNDMDSDERAQRSWRCAVVGSAHRNTDGTSRQDLIKMCHTGDAIDLRREPDNQHDSNAIAVWAPNGQIGYISRGRAERMASEMDGGKIFHAKISDITSDNAEYDVMLKISVSM